MFTLFFVVGTGLAGYAGYVGLEWYFIFISSLIVLIGDMLYKAPQWYGFYTRDGTFMFFKMFLATVIGMVLLSAAVYFSASGLNSLLS